VEETKRLATMSPRCINNHNMPYTPAGSANSAYTSWMCDLCRKKASDNVGSVWAFGRYHCKADQSDICTTCYDKNNANHIPTESNGKHSMPFTLNILGQGGAYKTGWHCDKCGKTSARNNEGVNGRFCCFTCQSDLCSPHCT